MTDHYPVKRRGERRRLIPNQAAIEWLEQQSETDTEISDCHQLGVNPPWSTINIVRGLGWYKAKRAGHYPRRMFDIFELEASSSNTIPHTACKACYDFAYSWKCAEHDRPDRNAEKPYELWAAVSRSARRGVRAPDSRSGRPHAARSIREGLEPHPGGER